MNEKQVRETLGTAFRSKVPLHVWGPPGVGKSAIVRSFAAGLGIEFLDLRVSMMDPVDLIGIPTVIDGRTIYATPEVFPREGSGVILLDELLAGSRAMQAPLYQLTFDRKLGTYRLPADWLVIGASNRVSDRAISSVMSTALASRFWHISLEADLPSWIEWAMSAGIRSEIIGGLRFLPHLLVNFDPSKDETTFATLRTWEMLSRAMDAGIPQGIELECMSGIIGRAAATEFIGFLSIYRSMPPIEGILQAPGTAAIPSEPSTLYAVCAALAARAKAETIQAILTYANRLHPAFGVMLGRDAVAKCPAGVRTPAYVAWATKHAEALT